MSTPRYQRRPDPVEAERRLCAGCDMTFTGSRCRRCNPTPVARPCRRFRCWEYAVAADDEGYCPFHADVRRSTTEKIRRAGGRQSTLRQTRSVVTLPAMAPVMMHLACGCGEFAMSPDTALPVGTEVECPTDEHGTTTVESLHPMEGPTDE